MNTVQVLSELEAAASRPTLPSIMPYHTIECAIVAIKAMQAENAKLREQVELLTKESLNMANTILDLRGQINASGYLP